MIDWQMAVIGLALIALGWGMFSYSGTAASVLAISYGAACFHSAIGGRND